MGADEVLENTKENSVLCTNGNRRDVAAGKLGRQADGGA
jgi:hypothetical protein